MKKNFFTGPTQLSVSRLYPALRGPRRLANQLRRSFLLPIICTVFVIPTLSHAASLSISPAQIDVRAGETREVILYVSSTDTPINAIAGHISFSKDIAVVSSISKTGSVVSFWANEPVSSNAVGTIDFEGVVFNPGFQGVRGKVLSLTVRGVRSGIANFSFSSGSVLANDGLGTDVTEKLSGATVAVTERQQVQTPKPVVEEPAAQIELPLLLVTSLTHPEHNVAYNTRTAQFAWELPEGASEVRLGYGKKSNAAPTVRYAPPITSKALVIENDGTYYFHAQYKKDGQLSPVTHYRFMVSSTGVQSPLTEAPAATSTDLTASTTPIVIASTTEEIVSAVAETGRPFLGMRTVSMSAPLVWYVIIGTTFTLIFLILLLKIVVQEKEIKKLAKLLAKKGSK